jgi:2-methylcitrate dehydratase PrpD
LINAMDFDPVSSAGHDVPAVVSAALVAVEHAGGSGLDLLEAIAVGLEVSARLTARYRELVAELGSHEIRHVGHPLFAPAVVAAIARAEELSAEECRHGIALATWMRPTDTVADYFVRTTVSMAKYTLFGQIAQVGLAAAELARCGFTGPSSVFGADQDFWHIGANREWEPLPMADGEWRHLVRHKLLPTNLPTIAVKAAFSDLVANNDLDADSIEQVVVSAGDSGNHVVMKANRLLTEQDCLLHFPYQLACLALRIPRVLWAVPGTRCRAEVRRFMDHVEVRESKGAARVEVATHDAVFAATASGGGTMTTPLSADHVGALVAKFIECAATVHGAEAASELAQQLLAVNSARVLDSARFASASEPH